MRAEDVLSIRNPDATLKDMVINSAIMAGLGFFTTLSAMAIAGVIENPQAALLAASIAAGFQFFATLAAQRGLKAIEKPKEAG